MGISKVVGCAATVLFSAAIYLKKSGFTYTPIPLLVGALVGFSVSIASHPSINLPSLLGKRSDGSFPLWAKLIFGPYLVSVRLYAVLKRLKRRESLYNEVSENLYVGGWPTSPGPQVQHRLNLPFVGHAKRGLRRSQFTFIVQMVSNPLYFQLVALGDTNLLMVFFRFSFISFS
ncbi:Dual specificity protein phosphatase Diacylglycerol kinase, catalytic region [Musa troglodytarum]|uniref:Dual specificity protein phosphatase Diacylglycerol kinase, catalytic region n=1 Tax=Musa troglodytarum TaxID=320322 RepID=A0A9E7IEB2_9LILI|nr:Dual specificity protein phosphatase Diacylglycerol kinase, catalytic region [Musa troglodytarum]